MRRPKATPLLPSSQSLGQAAATSRTVLHRLSAALLGGFVLIGGCGGGGAGEAPNAGTGGSGSDARPVGTVTDPTQTDLGLEGGPLRAVVIVVSSSTADALRLVNGYDERGVIVRQDQFVNGQPTSVQDFDYNAGLQLVERRDDEGVDRVVDTTRRFGYANGALTNVEIFDESGELEGRIAYEFDAAGLVASSNRESVRFSDGGDVEGDGVLVERTLYAYEDGRLSSEQIFFPDGELDLTIDYSYRVDGTLESTTRTSPIDGTIGSAVWEYEVGPCTRAWTNSTNAHYCIGGAD